MPDINSLPVTSVTIGQRLTFEEAFARLEKVVEALRDGSSTLDEALAYYEEGVKLARYCQQVLEHAELRVKQLTTDSHGQPVTEVFGE